MKPEEALAPLGRDEGDLGLLQPSVLFVALVFRSAAMERLLSRGGGHVSNAAKPIDVVAETDIGIAGALVVAIPGTAVLGTESPRPTAQHFILTFGRTSGILAG